MSKRWFKKLGISMLIFTLIVSLVTVAIPISVSAATEAVDIGIDVQKAYDVDVVLALDNSTQNIDTYKEDLQTALESRGVNASNLNIQSVEVNETNILEGKFELNLRWPGPGIDMDAHVEFWNATQMKTQLFYGQKEVHESVLDYDDQSGGVGEIISLSLDTIPSDIVELKVKINPYTGSDNTTMYLYKTVNGVKQEIIKSSAYVTKPNVYYFGSFKRNQDSWDFHFNNGTVFAGKEVEIISKDFMEVLREPDWRSSARKYLVNLNDQTVPDFDDSIELGEIVSRMGNDQIHYIGWGEDTDNAGTNDLTQNQAESFIRKNNGLGTFVNRTGSSYQEQINQTADYIASQSRNEANNEYLELDQNYDLIVTPSSELSNTKDENWPNGKWRIEHDPSIYENNTGIVPYSGQYLDDFLPTFNKVGQYDIYYADVLVKTLYVHRKPVSRFDVEVNSSNEVTLTNLSYDRDTPSQQNGIEEAKWMWKRTTDESWTSGKPSSFVPNEDYIIQLMVKDYQGTWSTARSLYQSTQSGAGKPISDFELSANQLIWPESTIEIENTSYDPRSADITEQQWTVYKNNEVIYTGNAPKLNFTNEGVGTYKISLKSKNQSGIWSETFSRFLKILPNSEPTISSIGNQSVTEGVTKEISFQVNDEETSAYSVTVAGSSSNTAIIPNENIVVTGNGKDRVVSITPAFGQAGVVTITLQATDGDMSVQQTFTITVVEKSAPTISSIEDQSINISDSSEEIEFTIGDEFFAANLISVVATSSNQELIADSSIVLGGTDENRTVSFTPVAGASGTADITIEATDPSGKKSVQIFKVTVSDLMPPNIVNVQVVNPDERYKSGDTIVIKVIFDEDVLVNGVPELALNFGSEPTRQAQYTGGSSTKELTFEYTIQAGDDTNEIRIAAEQALQLAGGSIQDGNNNNANLTLLEDFVWDTLIVDTVAPNRPSIEAQFVKPSTSIEITSDAPAVGEIAWLAPSGTTRFQEGTTMTKLVGNGSSDIIKAPLAEGTYYLYVIDANGNISVASENAVIVDNTNPNIAVISLPIAKDNVINGYEAEKTTISGTSEENAKVEVMFIDQDSKTVVVTTFADENGDWSIDPSDISSLADGTITVSVKVIDAAGNESVEIEQTIYKDTVTPINQNDVLFSNQSVKGNTIITLDAAAGEGITIFVAPLGTLAEDLVANGNTITSVAGDYSSIHAPLNDGIYHIYIMDTAGNVSEPSTATIIVDNIVPTINSLTPNTSDWVKDSVLVSINASDTNGSGIEVVKYAYGLQIPNYFITNGILANGYMFEVDTNGIYTVYVRDFAGNESVQFIQISNIDKQKPTAPSIQLEPNRDFYNGDYTISITPGQDSSSGVAYTEYRITGASEEDWTQYEEPIVISEEGKYTIETRTVDNVGNVSDVIVRTIVINRELTVFPTVSISPDIAYSNENVTVTISKSYDESHEDEGENSVIYYKIPSSGINEYVEYTGAFDITQEGQTEIDIMVRDRAGNEVTMTKIINIDKTAPINQDQILAENVITQGNTLITIQPSYDSEDKIWLAPVGTTLFTESETMTKAAGDATKIVTPSLDGEYRIYVIDKSGNISLSSDKTVTVDNVPPTVTGIADDEIYKEYPTISFDEGVATLNGQPFESDTKIEANGTYTLILTDVAGNSTVITFIVDNDKESVEKDTAALQVGFAPGDHPEWVSTDISLSDLGFFDSEIEWTSSHEDILSAEGKVTPPTVNTEVTLTATITKGDFKLEKTFTVLVIADPVKPVIALNGSSNVIVEQGQVYVEQGVQAIDNKDGNITENVVMSGFIDTKTIGVYTLVYTVSDKAGNMTQVVRTVTVVKPFIPASTIIHVDGDQKSTDNKIKEALKEANKQKTGQITLVVDDEVVQDAPIRISISKDDLTTAYNQKTKIELQTNNASILVPIRDLDMSQFTANSRLELVIEQLDVQKAENQALVTAIQNMSANLAIYDNKVFDFKMRIIEEDTQGNVISARDIENFQTTEDIVLKIFVGTNINEQLYFMTFYFNETLNEWQYIRSSYDEQSGTMILLTNHLSIYSVMETTKAQKQIELTNILNKENITVSEVRSILEDPDMDFNGDTMSKYDVFTDVHKDAVAQDIITKKPIGGYDYHALSDQVTNSVNSKHNAITTDTEKPEIKLTGPSIVYVIRGTTYVEQGAIATDNQDGDITGRIILIGSVDTTKNGTYILRYLITDVNGNQSEITRKVIVQNPTPDNEVEEPTLPVIIVDKNTGYVIKENKDITIVLTKEPQMQIVSQVYNVEVVSEKPTGKFEVQFSYDPSKVTNLNQLAVYQYDATEKRWVSVGGIIDPLNHTVTITLDSPATLVLMENKVVFKDLDGHWAKNIVEFLAARQIITGDTEGNFNPNMGITRAEFSTLIVRMLNLPINESASQFTDVTGQWYESYITTAQEFGIVKGVSDTNFEPERVVSRQEMAAIIIRTLKKYKNVTITEEDLKQIAEFADTDNISPWAFEDVYAAKKLGLMIGRDGNKFAPQSPTLRGEAASVIYNLLKELQLI
ncbi:MAG: S-layer homology domain-containing protein [Candidatus Pristimantibacillus lignocellulolyticus]|uniref:S-layer homology domain-containing protein n=1 Tax=Candidatus Pristimantibacillus lignocellulolyticus TaxID=2994561 RepID=A0A9J6ZHW8_9BACL|nr:MAG: S-layer homology domain-containing protein [Candidatus Pristimantibacillus lignocellulolyticus]